MQAHTQHETALVPLLDPPDRFVFSTDLLPPRDRFDAYRDGLFLHHMKVDVHKRGKGAFRAKIELAEAGGIVLGKMAASPTLYERKGHLLGDGNDGAVLYIARSGRIVTRQGASEFEYGKGSGMICRYGEECSTDVLSDSEVWTISLPSHVLGGFMRPGQAIKARGLHSDSASTQLLISYLAALWQVQETADAPLRQTIGAHVTDLVAHALSIGGDEQQISLGRGVKAARTQAVLRAIEKRHADPGLCADAIGQELGITSRQVHRLMEEMPKTFHEQVLECRLQRAAQLLADAHCAGAKIADIALSAGFVSPAYFSRAFRVRFGETPIAARAGRAA